MLIVRLNKEDKAMNRLRVIVFVLAAFAAIAFLGAGCDKTDKTEISDELQQMWPIWKADDLEINKRSGNTVQYTHELNLRPKYYTGKMPLVYTSKQPLSGMMMGMSGPEIFYAHEFGDFSNFFIYNDLLLKGIVAVDKSNKMVAEARLEWPTDVKSGFYRPKMEEFHYSGGMLVFHCKSEIDYDTGTKISESEQSGSKRRDYFFILPFGINAR